MSNIHIFFTEKISFLTMARGGPIACQNRFRDKVGGHACILQVLSHNPGLQIWQQAINVVLPKTYNYYITSHGTLPLLVYECTYDYILFMCNIDPRPK
jgi:hypothetical protein